MDPIQILFYIFSFALIVAALMVVLARNPVHGVLFLVLCFVSSAGLWLLLEAEFLALVLVLVYVGAVMTLFLFVVMMLDVKVVSTHKRFFGFLPVVFIIAVLVVGLGLTIITPEHFDLPQYNAFLNHPADYSNVESIAMVLYTDYVYPFEIAGVILLAAIIAAISLAFRGRRRGKGEKISEQLRANKADRLRLVK